jgi:formamidopyrimidine-DNA glycosylase
MPELPEVECVRRGLARANLSSKAICSIWRSDKPLRTGAFWRQENLHLLEGATTGSFVRRGKFLVWEMSAADGTEVAAVIHLGMTGQVLVERDGAALRSHTHLIVGLAGGSALHYVDARRFGGVHVDTRERLAISGPLSSLGPEPLSRGFSGDVLRARGGESKRAIRDVLLDQAVVAGLGNIYVSEALHLAGLPALVPAVEFHPSAWDRLADAVQVVLRQGLRNGGTTLRDYRGARGERGRNQAVLRVYGRAGQDCNSCGAVLRGYVHGGRSGVMCPRCQPARRRR